jgi:putative ABC transport system substrate-binding protein
MEYRWSDGRPQRFAALASELVQRQVSVIASIAGIPAARAAKAATTTIPVVFQGGFDPIEYKLVSSLSRPGGNVTGVSNLGLALGPKRLEIMHELLPAAKAIALIINPDHPNFQSQSREMQEAARGFGLEISTVSARAEHEFDGAFAKAAQMKSDAVVIGFGQPFTEYGAELGELASRHRMPAIAESREFVNAGGLLSYSGNREDALRLVGRYVGRILKGEKPADLPVQQATKVEMIVNMKAAKALGINVPLPLLGRADEVIE